MGIVETALHNDAVYNCNTNDYNGNIRPGSSVPSTLRACSAMLLARWPPRSSIWNRWDLSNGRVSPKGRVYTSSPPRHTRRLATPVTGSCASQTAARCGCSWPGGGGEATEDQIIILVMP